MSKLVPPDDGTRPYRPGLIVLLSIPLLIIAAWILVAKVRDQQGPDDDPQTATTLPELEKLREKPKPPSTHPLAGKRRLFLADGCLFRYQELTFTRYFSEQHDHPGIVIRKNDPTLWNFVSVPEKAHVYRIYCADPNFPEFHDHNLTYTRLVDDGIREDDQPPYLTLRNDDPCEWKVHQLEPKDQYELFCLSGADPFVGESLGWMTGQEDLEEDYVIATLGQNGRPSWWILPEGEAPILPRRASHLIVMNKGDIPDLAKSRELFADGGHEIFQVEFETEDDDFTRSAQDLDYLQLVKSLRGSDPVIEHPDFPSLVGTKLDELLTGTPKLERPDPLFPLIIPLKVSLYPHQIRELTLENTAFWLNTWESLEDFQSHLDESDAADGRIYHGDLFTYIFVSWDR